MYTIWAQWIVIESLVCGAHEDKKKKTITGIRKLQ